MQQDGRDRLERRDLSLVAMTHLVSLLLADHDLRRLDDGDHVVTLFEVELLGGFTGNHGDHMIPRNLNVDLRHDPSELDGRDGTWKAIAGARSQGHRSAPSWTMMGWAGSHSTASSTRSDHTRRTTSH